MRTLAKAPRENLTGVLSSSSKGAAIELFLSGRGRDVVSGALSVPRDTVKKWQ